MQCLPFKPLAELDYTVWDPFTGRPRFSYTGALRASYQRPEVPKREVPESIARPEYATNGKEPSGVLETAQEVSRVIRTGLRDAVSTYSHLLVSQPKVNHLEKRLRVG